jgi:hypothetical protein
MHIAKYRFQYVSAQLPQYMVPFAAGLQYFQNRSSIFPYTSMTKVGVVFDTLSLSKIMKTLASED